MSRMFHKAIIINTGSKYDTKSTSYSKGISIPVTDNGSLENTKLVVIFGQ